MVLDGRLQSDDFTELAHRIIADEIKAKDWEFEHIPLTGVKVGCCRGCFKCWVKTPGICVIDDDMRGIAEKAIKSDMVLLFTPVTFGGYSSEIKKAMDRLIPLISPFFMKINGEVYHKPRYRKYPSLISIGILSKPDEESARIFKTLVCRNAINLHSPHWGAEVLISNRGQEMIQRKIKSLLAKGG